VPIELFLEPVETYLVALDLKRGDLVSYAVSKMESPRIDASHEVAWAAKEGRARLGQAWGKMVRPGEAGTARVRFIASSQVARYFTANRMHAERSISEVRADGSIEVGLNVHSPVEICRYLLRFGPHVKILGDDAVLEEMREFLDRMREMYGKGFGNHGGIG
jgi:predicted DNA-binding transcriptional regulator YafY